MSKKDRAMFELSTDTRALVDRLRSVEVDEAVSYSTLSELIGQDVTKKARGLLESARRILQRDERMVFDVQRRVGLVRMTDSGIARSGSRDIEHVGRTARKMARRLSCVAAYDILSAEDKVRHNAGLTVAAVVDYVTKPRQVRAIEAGVKMLGMGLPTMKALDVLKA